MKKLIYLFAVSILVFGTTEVKADSYNTKAEKGVTAYIDEDLFGDGGTIIIENNSNETVRVMLLKAKPNPYHRGPVTLKQYKIVTIYSGKTFEYDLPDVMKTIHGIGVMNESKNQPYHIHGFKWPD